LKTFDLLEKFSAQQSLKEIASDITSGKHKFFSFNGLAGSSRAFAVAALHKLTSNTVLFVMNDKESAAYFYNDIEFLLGDIDKKPEQKKVFFFPSSFKRTQKEDDVDNINILSRTEVISKISAHAASALFIVTYPEAIFEKVVTKEAFEKSIYKLKKGDNLNLQMLIDKLTENHFDRVDFTVEPGQFSIRGGIIDVFSFGNENPYRIELSGNQIESLRTFDVVTQVSVEKKDKIKIIPNLSGAEVKLNKTAVFSFFGPQTIVGFENAEIVFDEVHHLWERTTTHYNEHNVTNAVAENHLSVIELNNHIVKFIGIDLGLTTYFKDTVNYIFDTVPQPLFNKKFDLLINNLRQNTAAGIQNYIFVSSSSQAERLENIFSDMLGNKEDDNNIVYQIIHNSIYEGFVDSNALIACYTDHQIFERYHRFRLREGYKTQQAFTLKELNNLQPGDYITHIDHGIGRFSGLEKVEINGKEQEALRIIYRDNDLLYLSIHSLHRISKYSGKEGLEPVLHKIGSMAWQNLKAKTKKRVKDIAKDLIRLYALRKATKGHAFMPDTYLQRELEASFIYEDTPDQIKSTIDVKKDLESENPMDRLICGDVGFGKTEIAVRAAFKVATESRQVAVLVPTTILALQHYNTFKERLKDFPCTIDYVSRLKSGQKIKESLDRLKEGRTDIIIGTHRLISKDVVFKDLGLLVIDEEQKFGVALKEKLKHIKVNVDTLTLTATPIPRTLQFSLLGARDLSIINTPPPNRYPILTKIISFNEEVIKEAIVYEISRGGQVFIVNNRIQNIYELANVLQKWLPKLKIAIGHGQLSGTDLEQIMIDFVDGAYDVLLATTIIESGLDIPNVNTIIIVDAHHFGLSDLHQLRGRVGRSSRKAFCYLVCPPVSSLTGEARKRLKAIEDFSDLGSGLNIAMRDLDIRGAGNLLGAEQSGFISEIGFEMYHRILDEAVTELKENDFKQYFNDAANPAENYIKECNFESDLEILIPTEYISNTAERLIIYKEINDIESEEDLIIYSNNLIDRFGPIPAQTTELFNVVRLRWLGKLSGMEKIVLKNRVLTCYFIQNQDSAFFASERFMNILNYIKSNPPQCRMKEANDKLLLYFYEVGDVSEALSKLTSFN